MNPYYLPGYKSPTPTPSGNIVQSYTPQFAPNDLGKDINYGGYAQAGIGLLSMGADWASVANQKLGLTDRETPSTDSYSGDYFNDASNVRVQHLGGGELLGGAAKGAAAGAAFGPWGAAIGAAAGTVGTIFASGKRRRRQEHERDQALSQALAYQSKYNTAQNYADQQSTAAADYQRRLSQYNQNLYNWSAI